MEQWRYMLSKSTKHCRNARDTGNWSKKRHELPSKEMENSYCITCRWRHWFLQQLKVSKWNVSDKEAEEAVNSEKQADGWEDQDAVSGKTWGRRLLDLTPAKIYPINPSFKSHYLFSKGVLLRVLTVIKLPLQDLSSFLLKKFLS